MSMWESIEREAARLAQDEVFKVAEKIAADARRNYRLKELRATNGVRAVRDGDDVAVVATYSFAHLDEWGQGVNLLSTPSAAMRRAAMKHGKFTPRPKGE